GGDVEVWSRVRYLAPGAVSQHVDACVIADIGAHVGFDIDASVSAIRLSAGAGAATPRYREPRKHGGNQRPRYLSIHRPVPSTDGHPKPGQLSDVPMLAPAPSVLERQRGVGED